MSSIRVIKICFTLSVGDLFSTEDEAVVTKVPRFDFLTLGGTGELLTPTSANSSRVRRRRRTRASGRTDCTLLLLLATAADPGAFNAASKASTLVLTDEGLKGLQR